MKTPRVAIPLVLAIACWAGNGCSRSAPDQLAKDGAAASDVPTGTGGLLGGSGGGSTVGTGGAGGIPGTDAGVGDGIPDGLQDLPDGTGGAGDAGRDIAIAPGTGGMTASGGRGGSGGSGGVAGGGGATSRGGSGGAAGAGGRPGSGGATGNGGSSGIDGGTTQVLCGYECRTDDAGVTGWYSGNTLLCTASCTSGRKAICSHVGSRSEGCYADSSSAGCPSGYNGLIAYTTCGERPYATAYLAWQAAEEATGTGPAVVVRGDVTGVGTLYGWSDTATFPAETPPSVDVLNSSSLSSTQLGSLFEGLAALDTTSLPHEPLSANGCSASLFFRTCTTCTPTTLSYPSSESLTPEMESVWSWFDSVVGSLTAANPRNYCRPVGAEP